MRRDTRVAASAPKSERTICRHRSIPAEIPGAGENLALVDIQHLGAHLDVGKAAPQLVCMFPVCRRGAAVHQPGSGQRERTYAYGRDPGPAFRCEPQRVQDDGRRVARRHEPGHDDSVGFAQGPKPARDGYREARG